VESQGVLSAYERALELTRAMLDAARKGDWDRLVAQEKERSIYVERIRMLDPDPLRDAKSRERKREIIAEMLRGDEQIQALTQDWMHELREVLGNINAQQRPPRASGP
jgi:flagellar protein FliT